MPTFLEAIEAYKSAPEHRGKSDDEVISEFVAEFRESTGRRLSEFDLNDQVPNFTELAEKETADAMQAEAQRKEQQGFGDFLYETASKAGRFVPRTAGIVAGAVSTAIDPKSYSKEGIVSQSYDDYLGMLDKSEDKDFLANLNTNLLDLREGTLHILATASGYSPNIEGRSSFGTGFETGASLTGGALGGTVGMVQNPIRSLYGRPADVLAMILSLRGVVLRGGPNATKAKRALQHLEEDSGKSGRGAGRNILAQIGDTKLPGLPGMRAPVKRRPVEVGASEAVSLDVIRRSQRSADEIAEATPDKPLSPAPEGDPLTVGDLASSVVAGTAAGLPFGVLEGGVIAPVARYLYGTAQATPAGARNLAKVRRFFGDPVAQSIIANEQQVRQLLREPARFRALINREGEALAKAAERLNVEAEGAIPGMADDFRYALDANEQSVYRPAVRLQQQINERADSQRLPANTMAELKQARALDKVTQPIEIAIPKLPEQASNAMRQIKQNMEEMGVDKSDFPVFEATVFDAMSEGATLLMSEALRNRMVNFIVDRNNLQGVAAADAAAALQKSLVDRFELAAPLTQEQRGGAAQLVMRTPGSLRLPNNETISLSQALEGTIGTMSEAERATVRQEVIGRVVRKAADKTSRAAFEQALRKEARRNTNARVDNMLEFGKGRVSAAEYGADIARGSIVDGQSLNQVLPKGMLPKNVADGIRGSVPELIRRAEEKVGRSLLPDEMMDLRRRVDDEANRVELYEEFTDDTKTFMPEEDLQAWPAIDQDTRSLGAADAARATNATYVAPGFNRTVWWNTLTHRWNGPAFDAMQNFNSLIKGNLTVHNPATHVGNYMSNVGVQSLRQGHSPLRVIFETSNEARKYLNYKKGKRVSDMDARTFNALEYSKLFDTDLVDAELGVMRRVSKSSPYGKFQEVGSLLAEPALKAWKKYDQAMKEGYKWGDQSFKIQEASKTFRTIASAIDRLDDGDYIRFQTSPTAHTTLVKQNGKIMRAGEVLTPEKLDRVIGAASVRRAFDLFVDYTQVPGLIMLLRQLGPLSIASPFVTWFWRTMDFPGKKGLIYRTLIDDPLFTTNNSGLTSASLTNSLYVQARRMLMFNGLRETLHDNREMMRRLIKLQGQSYGTGLFYESSNPGYFTFSRMNNTDFFSPGMHTVRVLAGAMAKRLELEEFDSLSKPQQRLVQRMAAGEVASMKDVFTMGAMSGGPIIEAIYQGITDRNRYGRPLRDGEWIKTLLPVIFGQLPTKLVDTTAQGLGIWKEETTLSQRKYSQNSRDANEREDYGPWAFRTLTGLGWRQAKAENRVNWYLNNLRRNMDQSLGAALKAKVKQLRRIGLDDRADLLVSDYQEVLKRIRMEMRIMKEEGRDLINALEHEEQLRVNPDMTGAVEAMEEME